MLVSIESITPAFGPASGHNIITIVGAGFQTPTIDLSVIPSPACAQTMSVTFSGVAALKVEVASTTKLYATVPPYSTNNYKELRYNYDPVDVSIANIDENGNTIFGAEATLAEGYTYQRKPLQTFSFLSLVLQAFIKRLLTEVTPNVGYRTHPEFGDFGEQLIRITKVPSISLSVQFLRDNIYADEDVGHERFLSGDEIKFYRGMSTYRAECYLMFADDSVNGALHLVDSFKDAMALNPHIDLVLPASHPLYPGETIRYDIDVGENIDGSTGSAEDGISVYGLSCWIRGIKKLTEWPVKIGNTIDVGEAKAFISDMSGENQTEISA
jgi:hypothetical protein